MDIIFFAAIALVILLKLGQQLGKITDEEKEQITKKVQQQKQQILKIQDQVIKQVETVIEEENKLIENLNDENKEIFKQILAKFKITADFFFTGAKSAFEMTLKAFAEEDSDTLKFLLSDKIYQNFTTAIKTRQENKQKLNTNLISVEKTEIISCNLNEKEAIITISFKTKQINYITNENNEIIQGDKSQISELTDIWTFKKDLSDTTPNWKITATG